MALVMCPLCTSDDDVYLVAVLPDGRRRVSCRNCDYAWDHGEALTRPPLRSVGDMAVDLRGRFPRADDASPGARDRAERLKRRFLTEVFVEPDPKVAPFWAKYQYIFSQEGLPEASPDDLKAFANDPIGAYAGFMTVFNNAWNKMGPEQGASMVRQVIEYLLRGPDPSLENRLTDLILGKFAFSIPGFKEALLTKALCVVHPDRFMTIVTYDQKRIMAKAVYDLDLPDPDRVSWTIGRLIVWSNDLLRDLTGDGFVDQQHAGEFLWWGKDRASQA